MRLQVAIEARRFEIDLFWRRSAFFWAFIAAAIGAVAWSYGAHPRLAIVFSTFAFVCSCIWSLVNRGSRFWHVNWESKVQEFEDDVIGPVFKNPQFSPGKNWWPGARYSPSRLVIALSDYVATLVGLLLGYQVATGVRLAWPPGLGDVAVGTFVAGSLVWLLLVKLKTLRHDA